MSDRPARDAVLTAYAQSLIKYKARKLSRKPGFSRSDEEDLAQELTVALLAKAHMFDPNRGSLNTFVDRVIRTAIAMLLRDRRRLKRAAGFFTRSLDQDGPQESDQDWSLLESLEGSHSQLVLESAEQSEMRNAVAKAIQSLPPDLQSICSQLRSRTVTEIARDLGVSRRQVRHMVERIRTHFEDEGLKDFLTGADSPHAHGIGNC